MAADCFYYCLGYGFLKQVAHLIQRHTVHIYASYSLKKRAKEGQWFDTSCKQGEPLFFSTKDQIVHFATLFATCSICWLHPINILTCTVLVLTLLVRTVHCTWYCCALYPLYPLYRMNPLSWINWVESIWLTRINWIMLVHQSNHSNQLNHVSPPIKTSAVLKAWMSSANPIESS